MLEIFVNLTCINQTPVYPEHKRRSKLVLLCVSRYTVQPVSITKTLLIVPTKNERDPPLFTGKLLITFQNILRNTTQVIIRHDRVKSPITLERQK